MITGAHAGGNFFSLISCKLVRKPRLCHSRFLVYILLLLLGHIISWLIWYLISYGSLMFLSYLSSSPIALALGPWCRPVLLDCTLTSAILCLLVVLQWPWPLMLVSEPNSVPSLNQTHVVEWCVVRCGASNGHLEDMCSKEIGWRRCNGLHS